MESGEGQSLGVRVPSSHRTARSSAIAPPRYGILTARDADDWFLRMMQEHEEFEVSTDRAGEWPMPFWSETVWQVVVE